MEILLWDGISLLFFLVWCIFSRLVAVKGIGKHRKEEGSSPCLWKGILSILLGGSCLVLGLRLGCSSVSGSLGGAEVSEARAAPQSSAVLRCTGSLQG